MSGLIKPGRWNVNPGDLSLENQSLWNGLVSLVPIWEGGSAAVTDMMWRGEGPPAIPAGNATLAPTPFGPGLDFDGTSDWISWNIQTDSPWEGLFDFSSVLIVRFDRTTGFDSSIIRKDGTFNFQNVGGDIRIAIWPGGILRLRVMAGLAGLAIGDWNMFVINWNESTGVLDAYQYDFTERTLSTDTYTHPSGDGALDVNNTKDYRWGATEGGLEEFDGSIAFYAAWDRLLSQAEIQQLMREPFGLITPAPFVQTEPIAFFDLTDMPADFGTADNAAIQVRSQATNINTNLSRVA